MGSWARLGRKFLLGEFKWRICLESASKLQSTIAEAGVLTWAGRWERISRVRSVWLQRSAPQPLGSGSRGSFLGGEQCRAPRGVLGCEEKRQQGRAAESVFLFRVGGFWCILARVGQ